MVQALHPSINVLKDEIKRGNYNYPQIARGTGLTTQRLKNILSGRADITLKERDLLCIFLDISPIDVVMRREDLLERKDFLDLRGLPEQMKTALIIMHREICQLVKKLLQLPGK